MERAAGGGAAGGQYGGRADLEDLPAAGWRDNVPRRIVFEAANRDVVITCKDSGYRWHARGYLASGWDVCVSSTDLGELLDRLGAP